MSVSLEVDISCSLFSRFLSIRMGNGASIWFWEDIWIGNSSFASDFPGHYRVANSHGSSIASLACSSFAPIAWNLSFARNLSDREAGDLASSLSRIDHLSLDSSLCDKLVWLLHSSEVFSCKSFFEKITEKSNIPFFSLHKRIWKSFAPLKVKLFVWSLVHRSILTNEVLQKRRPNCYLSPHWCIMCKGERESLNHFFLHCSVARSLWQQFFA